MSGAILLLLLSWGLLAFGKTSVVALIVGIVVLDLGAQAMHISNQSAVYYAARTGPQPADHRVHGRLLQRRRGVVGGHLGALCERRLGGGVRARRGTAAVGLITWLVTERVMTRPPADRRGQRRIVGADSAA